MRTLIPACLLLFLTGGASASVLPIDGSFCHGNPAASDNWTKLTADALEEKDFTCSFSQIVQSGPNWWRVSARCQDGEDELRVEREGKKAEYTVQMLTPERSEPLMFRACK